MKTISLKLNIALTRLYYRKFKIQIKKNKSWSTTTKYHSLYIKLEAKTIVYED